MSKLALTLNIPAKDAQLFDHFLENFISPLLFGGRCEVLDYISPKQCERLCKAVQRTGRNPNFTGQLRQQSLLISPQRTADFDADCLRICFAIHNLFVSLSEDFLNEDSLAIKYAQFSLIVLKQIQWTLNPAQLIVRHLILRRFFAALRRTTQVNFWAGKRQYIGTTPSKLLLTFPRLRRVTVEQETEKLYQKIDIPDEQQIKPMRSKKEKSQNLKYAIIQQLFDYSPLTQFLSFDKDFSADYPLKLYSTQRYHKKRISNYNILKNRYLARSITDHILLSGSLNKAGAQIALNFLQALRESASKEELLLICHFSINLIITLCFTQATLLTNNSFVEIEAFIKEYQKLKTQKHKNIHLKALRSFYALILALFSLEKEGLLEFSDLKTWPEHQRAYIVQVQKILNDKELKQFSRSIKQRLKERIL